jgi:hypothetical protein
MLLYFRLVKVSITVSIKAPKVSTRIKIAKKPIFMLFTMYMYSHFESTRATSQSWFTRNTTRSRNQPTAKTLFQYPTNTERKKEKKRKIFTQKKHTIKKNFSRKIKKHLSFSTMQERFGKNLWESWAERLLPRLGKQSQR